MSTQIHPTAVVAKGAELGRDVVIGPYSVVGGQVKIGDRTQIGPHVVVDGVTTIGGDNVIVGQANLGGPPQDLSYRGEPTWLEIGDANTVREFVTIIARPEMRFRPFSALLATPAATRNSATRLRPRHSTHSSPTIPLRPVCHKPADR